MRDASHQILAGGASPSSPGTATISETLGALTVPAFTNDLDGFVTWQNEASLALAGDVRGSHYTATVPPTELQRTRETFAAVALSGATRRVTNCVKTADGRLVRVEAILGPIRKGGEIVGLFGISIALEGIPDETPIQLSARQLDVLRLLVRGKSTRQIAEALHIAPETVRNHIARLLKALGARTRLEAVVIAHRHGLVSLELE